MRRIVHGLNQILSAFCGWLMLAMMVLLIIDIVTRSAKKPLQGMAELSVFVMMVVIYLGLARCEENRGHVYLEIGRNLLPPSLRRICEGVAYLFAMITAGVLLYVGTQNALFSFMSNESIEGTVELRIWPIKFIMVIGLVFFFLQILLNGITDCWGKQHGPRQDEKP